MSRVFAFVFCGAALAGCTASGDLMKTATPTVPLQFESSPAGAEVKTSGGQTCRTPCALAVPAADMQATYSLTGYQPQTVLIKLMPPEDIRGAGGDESGMGPGQPRFDPNPVMAELVKGGPARRPAKKTPVAKRPAPSSAAMQEPPEPGDAPPQRSSTSGFNPPPSNNGGGFSPPPQQRAAPAAGGGWPAPGR